MTAASRGRRRAAAAWLLAVFAAGGATASCPPPSSGDPVELYPSAEILPENLLRLYLYFPRPMGRGDILETVGLFDAEDRPIDGVFLANQRDLWSPDRRRLTLLLDPGRVKTGLVAHEALGRALTAGARYTLRIDGATADAEGCPLGADAAFAFVAGPADQEAPSPEAWALEPPLAGTMEPLIVDLGDAHDHLSLAFRLRVHGPDGAPIPGRIALGPNESSWIFTPASAWPPAQHSLRIDERLEDLAGNRPGALFDQALDTPEIDWSRELFWTPTDASD